MIAISQLVEKISYECIRGSMDAGIEEIVYDSRKVSPGCLFVCVEGANADGHAYAREAAAKGARALLVSKDVEVDEQAEITVIRVEDTRYAMAFMAAAFWGYPAEQLKIIGITGTKGKTTTTYLVKSILEQAGHRVGLIGTIEVIIGDDYIPASHTTPESYYIQEYFHQMAAAGCDTVVMEVSSQGLKMHRTQGFVFDIGIFTNLEPDHIGPNEHAGFEEYMACKGLLFRQCRTGIVNRDDKHWQEVIKGHTCAIETYGLTAEADLWADDIEFINGAGYLGVSFQVKGLMDCPVAVSTPGRFSVYNALTAVAICRHFGVAEEQIKDALFRARVKGRIEMVPVSEEFTLLIDYAHNAMALESLLTTLKEYRPGRLVCLFGCGGNRSPVRRYEMGEVSGKLADLTVITSDNPRFEEPQAIIEDIKQGIARTTGEYVEIKDRREAIAYVIHNGRPGDVIVLAGKGHEDYQEIKGQKYRMDEREIIKEVINWEKHTEMSSLT